MKLTLITTMLLVGVISFSQSPAIEVEGNGVLFPRLTSIDRDAISSPQAGLVIFNTDINCLELYRGNGWYSLCEGGDFSTIKINTLLGGSANDEALNLISGSDNSYYVIGSSASSSSGDVVESSNGLDDYWLLKLSETGDTLWTKLLGGNGEDNGINLVSTNNGGVILIGQSGSDQDGDVTDTSNGSIDYWVVSLDSEGNVLWNKLLGGNSIDIGTSITSTLDNGYVVVGGAASSNNGDVTEISNGFDDYWVVKLDSTGNIVWNNMLGGPSRDIATDVIALQDSGFVVAGTTVMFGGGGDVTGSVSGDSDGWIVKVDKNGNKVWDRLIGGNGRDVAVSVDSTSDGGFIIAGFSNSTSGNVSNISNGMLDFYIAKLNSSGVKLWDKLIGGDDDDEASSIIETSDGGYMVVGRSKSSMTDDVTDMNNGMFDFWVVKLDSFGNIQWNRLLGGAGDDEASSVIELPGGGYLISGRSASKNSGDVEDANNGMFDYWIVKLDENGIIQN